MSLTAYSSADNCVRYGGRAFTAENNDPKVLGNPATTFICDKFPTQETMVELSKSENQPITSFIVLKSKKGDKKVFDIRYFFPTGKEINVCGHGTIFSSLSALQHYKTLIKAEFIPNQSMYEGSISLDLSPKAQSSISVKKCNFKPLDKKNTQFVHALLSATSVGIEKLSSVQVCPENNDILIVLKDAKALRAMDVDSNKTVKALKKLDSNFRGITVTAQSDEKKYTYETRILTTLLAGNEDLACGSANMETATYWSNKLNKDYMFVLYPHKYNKTGKFGGVQEIEIKDDKIYIKGFAKFD